MLRLEPCIHVCVCVCVCVCACMCVCILNKKGITNVLNRSKKNKFYFFIKKYDLYH